VEDSDPGYLLGDALLQQQAKILLSWQLFQMMIVIVGLLVLQFVLKIFTLNGEVLRVLSCCYC